MATVLEPPAPDMLSMAPVEPIQDVVAAVEPQGREKTLWLAQKEGDLSAALSEADLVDLGQKVVEDYDTDNAERDDWVKIVKESLKAASQEGDCEDASTGVWKGASNVKYPLITVGALQFAARAYPAIVKGDEAVSVKVVGQDKGRPQLGPDGQPMAVLPDGRMVPAAMVSQLPPELQQALKPAMATQPGAKAARAMRVREYMNTTIFYRMDDWESDTDALLHQLPIVGCAFRKVWHDAQTGKQCAALVPALRLVVPMSAKTCATAPRMTEEVPDVYPVTLLERMRDGVYRTVDLGDWDGRETKPRMLLEQHRLMDMDGDGMPEPYIVTVDHETREVLRVEANFAPDSIKWDGDRVMRIARGRYYVKYGFFPHPEGKFYDIGLGHLLRQIGAVVDTAINQMIDAGHAQVAGGGFIGSGVRLTGSKRAGNLRFEPGEYKTVDVPGDQLRNAIVERTFPAPSPIMFQILDLMLGAATDISSVKDVVTGEASNNGQVGTTLALIEQGLAQFTAIYKRIYRSLKEEYQLLFENIGKYGGDEAASDYAAVLDDGRADFRADFNSADLDIRPVSDPSSVTKMQKMARAQFLMQFIGAPGVNPQAIMKRAWEAADVDDADELLLQPQPPAPDPVAEAEAGAKEAKGMRDFAEMEHAQAKTETEKAKAVKTQQEAEAVALDNLAKAFGAGRMVGLA